MSQQAVSEIFIQAAPAQVFYALTHATSLHEWLCDYATVAPRPGGRMYLWWHGDFYSAGEYISLEENKKVKFKWFGRGEPAAREVSVTLTPKEDGTLVNLAHSAPDGPDWKERLQGFKEQWEATLPNLVSVLEQGIDRRTFDRPMLGINISDFNAEIAKALQVPVDQGMRLDDVRPGMGAHAAGLQKDDVLVELDGKPVTNDFGSLLAALAGKKGGDTIEAAAWRGPEKKTFSLTLSRRPIPDISWNPTEMAERVRKTYETSIGQLESCFTGVSESDADREPAANEWSAKQTLAHLIQTERAWISNLDDLVGGYERLSDDWGGNLPAHIDATVKAYGSVKGMLDELKRLSVEMVTFVANLPDSFMQRKASYFTMAAQLLEQESHTLSHIDQIKAALKVTRNSKK
jgi:uncharacterized protein YndB with AHSA1/START domain